MKWTRTSMPEAADRELTFAQAIREALAEEMRRDETVCIMGEDVAEAGTPFKVLSGLLEEFGKDRVLDTPISDGDAHHDGSDSPLGRATLAVAACVVLPRSRSESCSAFDTLRCQGTVEGRDSRRKSSCLFRRQNDVQAKRPGTRGRLHRA